MDVTEILFTLLASAALILGVTFWRTWAEKVRNDAVQTWADTLVNAAEQLYGGMSGERRLEWVMEQLCNTFPRIDRSALRAIVEAAVQRVNARTPVIVVDNGAPLEESDEGRPF